MRYAQNTEVSSDKSRLEIERTLIRFGASGFLYGWQGSFAQVMFEMHGRRLKFMLKLPNREDFTETPSRGYARSPRQVEQAYEQAVRQKWRALFLAIKGKLVSVDDGIEVFEDAFMANIVLPDGETVGDWMKPQIAQAYETKRMPRMVLALPGKEEERS
jgi:hypothetical protein